MVELLYLIGTVAKRVGVAPVRLYVQRAVFAGDVGGCSAGSDSRTSGCRRLFRGGDQPGILAVVIGVGVGGGDDARGGGFNRRYRPIKQAVVLRHGIRIVSQRRRAVGAGDSNGYRYDI
ncbi:hypothetical protein SDC9_210119 [bioreactor metagenome]|uniref:Uncharacterized protein n=1 Tax=bioreactor metagenome TaxID=1076179 RepID=A0A645JGM9_9ZZZZ